MIIYETFVCEILMYLNMGIYVQPDIAYTSGTIHEIRYIKEVATTAEI